VITAKKLIKVSKLLLPHYVHQWFPQWRAYVGLAGGYEAMKIKLNSYHQIQLK
jgi:hypothetical protein